MSKVIYICSLLLAIASTSLASLDLLIQILPSTPNLTTVASTFFLFFLCTLIILLRRRSTYTNALQNLGASIPNSPQILSALSKVGEIRAMTTPLSTDVREFGVGRGKLDGIELRRSALNTWELLEAVVGEVKRRDESYRVFCGRVVRGFLVDDEEEGILEEYCSGIEGMKTELDVVVSEERYLEFITTATVLLKILESYFLLCEIKISHCYTSWCRSSHSGISCFLYNI
jgi:hypothetical protein